jgi:thioredoxin-like negative regulator of GroEL
LLYIEDAKKTMRLIGDEDFATEVLQSEILTIAFFWAPWSRPTNLAALILDAVAESHKGIVKVIGISMEEHTQTAKAFRVLRVPTLIYFVGGKDVARAEGFSSGRFIEATIKKLLAVPG